MSKDAEIEIAAAVIEDLLYLLPANKRAAVLAKAIEKEEAERKEREKNGGWRSYSAQELQVRWKTELRYWHRIMQFKVRVAYAFIRCIVKNHSPEDAGRLLLRRQRNPDLSSGFLLDYLNKLPRSRSTAKSPHSPAS